MLKALTFLGLGKYENTTYIKHDESNMYETDLFPIAVAELYGPEKIIAFTTSKVVDSKQKDLKKLGEVLGEKFTTKDIPDGNSTDELWDIFARCIEADVIEENDEIILDITHAFRSIPLLIFIVAAYLRQIKQVKLVHIIYGAFEARNQDTNQTPIFDLTPFVELLDWMNAFTIFQRSGDASDLAKLNLPNSIENALTNVSAALLTNRTFEAQETISRFVKMNFNHPESLLRQPVPFQMLTERLKESYKDIGVNRPRDEPQKSLNAQYEQIKWYVVNQHYLQAITLMREWMVSWKCLQLNQENWLNQDSRRSAEDKLNERVNHQDPYNSDFTQLWRQCRDLRNDLAHCGIREDPRRSRVAINATQELFNEFEKFVRQNFT
ncbi:MAG: TIGR02221 family CRISPR-associated protein [Candidatus Poribacteria bacterium]|nr:TIGR02221 family CRISPR-associated protein [Candidatus Poribacteria bacterium]